MTKWDLTGWDFLASAKETITYLSASQRENSSCIWCVWVIYSKTGVKS